jgi:hypothetical protein
MSKTRQAYRLALALAGLALAVTLADLAAAQEKGKLRFGVGPLQATPTETKKASTGTGMR